MKNHWIHRLGAALLATTLPITAAAAPDSLLNVSYDVSRGFYKDYNPKFVAHYREQTGREVTVKQSHGGSGKQARAVIEGLDGDVLTMNSGLDIDIVATRSQRIAGNFRDAFPHQGAPSWSTTLFIVRKGNPKRIQDWPDLAREGVAVVIPNPKTSGNGRYSYLAAWIHGLQSGDGGEDAARDFVSRLFANVPILDGGGRGATTSFAQRNVGDVLLTFESEVNLILEEFGQDAFEVVIPSLSVRADNPVAIVTGVTENRGSTGLARAYLDYLYSDAGQDLYVQHHLRPAVPAAWERHRARFPELKAVDIEATLGASWLDIFEQHFRDGGVYDQLTAAP